MTTVALYAAVLNLFIFTFSSKPDINMSGLDELVVTNALETRPMIGIVPFPLLVIPPPSIVRLPSTRADPLTSNCALGTVPPKQRAVSVRLMLFPVRPKAYSAATSSGVRATPPQILKLEMEPPKCCDEPVVLPIQNVPLIRFSVLDAPLT